MLTLVLKKDVISYSFIELIKYFLALLAFRKLDNSCIVLFPVCFEKAVL